MRHGLRTTKKLNSLEGQLLIASRSMIHPQFHQAVVLVLHHSQDGAMGVVLNHPLPPNMPEVWEFLGDSVHVGDRRAHLGGPVPGSITVVHDVRLQNETQGRIYVLEKGDQFLRLLDALHDEPYRFFVGHAGWGRGQLEAEVASGLWKSIPGTPSLIFEHPSAELWRVANHEAGCWFCQQVLNIRHVPASALLN